MGVLSLSYLFGDALARLYLGAFANAGVGWRELFFDRRRDARGLSPWSGPSP